MPGERDLSSRMSLIRMRYNFLGVRDENVNLILCQFQNRNSKYSFCNTTQTFETDIERNVHFCP